MNNRLSTQAFFDPATWTVTYVVPSTATRHAAIIDPVLDYDFKSGQTSTTSADQVLAYLKTYDLTVEWILETHAHADHLSGAHYLKEQVGGAATINKKIMPLSHCFASNRLRKKVANATRPKQRPKQDWQRVRAACCYPMPCGHLRRCSKRRAVIKMLAPASPNCRASSNSAPATPANQLSHWSWQRLLLLPG